MACLCKSAVGFWETFCLSDERECPSPFLPALNINTVSAVTAAILCLWANVREGKKNCDILALTSQTTKRYQQLATSGLT